MGVLWVYFQALAKNGWRGTSSTWTTRTLNSVEPGRHMPDPSPNAYGFGPKIGQPLLPSQLTQLSQLPSKLRTTRTACVRKYQVKVRSGVLQCFCQGCVRISLQGAIAPSLQAFRKFRVRSGWALRFQISTGLTVAKFSKEQTDVWSIYHVTFCEILFSESAICEAFLREPAGASRAIESVSGVHRTQSDVFWGSKLVNPMSSSLQMLQYLFFYL